MERILNNISFSIYSAFLPITIDGVLYKPKNSASYIEHLWQKPKKTYALLQTTILIVFFFLPMLILKYLKPFSMLNDEQKKNFIYDLTYSKIYHVRLIVYAIKIQALLSFVQDKEIRIYFGYDQ